jgi:hypothetical protein
VMISNGSSYSEARMWNGSSWANPGVIINGDMVVNGSLAAEKIDTRNLTIRDASGNVIMGAGAKMDVAWLSNLGALGKKNNIQVNWVDSDVRLPDGSQMKATDFVNKLSKIGSGNIGVFMENAAIGNAYIGNAAVSTLTIQGNAVTVPVFASNPSGKSGTGFSNWTDVVSLNVVMDQAGWVYVHATAVITYGSGFRKVGTNLLVNGASVAGYEVDTGYISVSHAYAFYASAGSNNIVTLRFKGDTPSSINDAMLFAIGSKR